MGGEHRVACAHHRSGVADVDRHGAEAVFSSEALEHVGAAPADDHGVAGLLQAQCEGEADARRAAGDEDGVAGDVHGVILSMTVTRLVTDHDAPIHAAARETWLS